MNLYLALINYGKNAKFTTVWEQGHTEAERTGTADDNFIAWINEIEGKSSNSNFSSFLKGNIYILFISLILSCL